MENLVWRPEPEKLAKARSIICDVPELLLEVLEHDYTNAFSDSPEDPIEIRYYWPRNARGSAWNHLMRHVPVIELVRDGEEEFFVPVFEPKRHPYRKQHGADYWAWIVLKWELLPADMVREARKADRSNSFEKMVKRHVENQRAAVER